jgi:branched-subunit amino acid ABC-type transport system permease component
MSAVISVFFQALQIFGVFLIVSLGLSIIYGVLGIMNLAHGELMTIGAYATVLAVNAGLPLPLGILLATALTAVLGLVLDRAIMRRLYSRPTDAIVVTFGVSLVVIQALLLIFGSAQSSRIPSPGGVWNIAGQSIPVYRLLVSLIGVAAVYGLYLVFQKTRLGTNIRAVSQDGDTASCFGVDTRATYTIAFVLGAALAGLAGGLVAPTVSLTPSLGQGFVVYAFVIVVVAGERVFQGTLLASAAYALLDAAVSYKFGSFYGVLSLLGATLLLIRVLPGGFSGVLRRRPRLAAI